MTIVVDPDFGGGIFVLLALPAKMRGTLAPPLNLLLDNSSNCFKCLICNKPRLQVLRPRHKMRQIAATRRCNKSPRVAYENCRCDRILSLRSVARTQTGLNSCDISQRQTKRKWLVIAAVQMRRCIAAICRIVCLGLYSTWVLQNFSLSFCQSFCQS